MKETHQARAPTVLRTGRPNREPLDTNEVIAYAIALAEQLGVSIPKRKKAVPDAETKNSHHADLPGSVLLAMD